MVGNKSEFLDKFKNKRTKDPNYCFLCCCLKQHCIDHNRAHKLRQKGDFYSSFKYLRPKPKFSDKGFPADYLLEDGHTINPRYLIGGSKLG